MAGSTSFSSAALSRDIREDSVAFAKALLRNADGTPLIPHAGQETLLHGIQPLTVACCGRQFGKSVGVGIHATWYAVTHANRQVYIVAPSLDQSRIIFNEIAFQFRHDPLKRMLVGKIVDFPFPKIKLLNGTEIHARGANSPQYIRGKKAHLIICDEAAFMKDKTITDTIEPMLTVTGKEKDSALILISTPFGQGAFQDFYHACVAGEGAHFHFSSLDNPHADRKRLERIKIRYGEDSLIWQTEYLANFVDDDLAVFPSKHIKWAYENWPATSQDGTPLPFPVAPASRHHYVQGVDLANVRDYFVASVLDITDAGRCILSHYDRLQKRGYTHYKQVVRDNYERYNHAQTLIDATSLGESVVDDLRGIGAEGYRFSSTSKYEIVQELARMLAEHRFLFPHDPVIINELRHFTYEITPSKNLKMEAKEGHDDVVMSLALCAHLACIPRSTGFFQGVDFGPKKKPLRIDPTSPTYVDPWKALWNEE